MPTQFGEFALQFGRCFRTGAGRGHVVHVRGVAYISKASTHARARHVAYGLWPYWPWALAGGRWATGGG